MSDIGHSREALLDLYDNAPCGFFSCTLEGVVVNVNATLLRWLNSERTRMLGTSFSQWLPPGDGLFYETRFLPAIRLRGEVGEVGLTLQREDGSPLPVLMNANVQSSSSSEPLINVAVFDVTQRVDYVRSLLDARRTAEASETRVQVLHKASAAFACADTMPSLLGDLAEIAKESFGAASSTVMLVEEGDQFVIAAGAHPLTPAAPGTHGTPERDAASSAEAVTVCSLDDADLKYPGLSTRMRSARLAAITATPLLDDDRVLGVLLCFFRRGRDFDESILELQRTLARQAAQVMLRLRLEQERRLESDEAERLWRVGREISTGLRTTNSPHDMVQFVTQQLCRALGADQVRIALLGNRDLPHLHAQWPHASTLEDLPDSSGDLSTIAAPLWSDYTSAVASVSAEDDSCTARSAHRYFGWSSAAEGCALVAPLGERDVALGIIGVIRTQANRLFSPTEQALFRTVSSELSHHLLQASLLRAQKDAVERLIQLDKKKVDLIATFNHELRTPLTSIIGYSDLISERLERKGLSRENEMLSIVQSSATRLEYLFENMMAAARQDGSRGHVEIEQLDVGVIVRTVVDQLVPVSEGNAVTVAVHLPEDLVFLGDRGGIEQVFTNVISNAIKFSLRGGVVTVRAYSPSRDEPRTLTVDVTDAGIGIPHSDLADVGSKLFRADNARSAAIQGSGLGLYISRGIMEAAGGRLDITSTLGAGTTVAVRIPLVDRRSA